MVARRIGSNFSADGRAIMYIQRGSFLGQDPLPAQQAAGKINWCQMRQTIAATARAEEARWTRPNRNRAKILENNPNMLPVLTSYWATVPGFENLQRARFAAQRSALNDPRFFWSAAFICFVMHTAGVRQQHGFEFSPRHIAYIVEAMRNRERSDPNRVFWLLDRTEIQNEAKPQPGDLLCFNRVGENNVMTNHTYAGLRQRFWPNPNPPSRDVRASAHTALVVGPGTDRQGRPCIETIGGNERGSVRLNCIRLNAAGGILNPAAHHIFGMIKIIGC
jgi:hypothetical protein